MKDIFDTTALCSKCKTRMDKKIKVSEGHKLRFFNCTKCSEQIYHPLDLKKFEDFQKLKQREFQVKLRMVGNSFSVTIPKEIIEFEEQFTKMEREMDKMMRLSLEEPGRIRLCFRKMLEE